MFSLLSTLVRTLETLSTLLRTLSSSLETVLTLSILLSSSGYSSNSLPSSSILLLLSSVLWILSLGMYELLT